MILVSAGRSTWVEVVLNWMAAAHRLRVYSYVLLSLDGDMHAALARVAAPSFLPPDPAWAASQEPL